MIKISESSKKIDVRGLFCPSPALQTTVELSKMQVELKKEYGTDNINIHTGEINYDEQAN